MYFVVQRMQISCTHFVNKQNKPVLHVQQSINRHSRETIGYCANIGHLSAFSTEIFRPTIEKFRMNLRFKSSNLVKHEEFSYIACP